MAKKRRTREEQIKHNRTVRRKITGGVFVFFALVGMVSVLTFGGIQIAKLFNTTDVKTAFEKQIEYVVALDPVPFNITESPDDDLLLKAAIWKAINNYPEENRTYDEKKDLILPEIEVTKAAASIYSSEYTLKHHTVNYLETTFEYNKEKAYYTIPATSLSGVLYPQVVAVTREGGTRVLSVAYKSPSLVDYYTGTRNQDSDKLVKYMEYVMVRNGSEWRLQSVRTPILPETPSLGG